MKLSVSAYRAHASAHKKILSSSYQTQLNYGSTAAAAATAACTQSSTNTSGLFNMETEDPHMTSNTTISSTCSLPGTTTITSSSTTAGVCGGGGGGHGISSGQIQGVGPMSTLSPTESVLSPTVGTRTGSNVTSKEEEEDSSNQASSDCKSPGQRTKSNQRWMKLRTTVQLSSAIKPSKPPLKREDSFLKRFSTRQIPETQETVEDTGSESATGDQEKSLKRRWRYNQKRKSVVNPDENFYFHWLMVLTVCVLYNLWTLIVRQSFPELQELVTNFWFSCDCISDIVFVLDLIVQLRTGYLEQGLMVYDDKKLACHYMRSREFLLDLAALIPLDLLQLRFGAQPLLRFPRFFKVYRSVKFYYIVESRTVWPNLWRVVNLIHILLILAHWFGCFYFLLSEAEGFQGDWVYPYRPGDYATLTRKYLGSLYWSTLTLTTIGDLPTPETNAEPSTSVDGPRSLPRRGLKSRLLQFASNNGYIFTIVSYLIGVFIFATIVGQVGNVITNRNANRLEFERLLDGAKTYMRHHKVPGGMKRRVLRWYDYSWSRGRIQGGGDINTALGLLPDKLKTELALHVNLSVLKKVTIFQECQPEFLHDLVLKMKAYIFTPGDSICRKGEVAREMFIIADGILEVLSETGKVLTTMKAGDFFGEIGILNLDGLNKRTADVRSVGYSELFSLSREDVLAAMKDYPEAQEILQTLGRKRLMEVRCVNKKHAKIIAEKEMLANAQLHGHHGHGDNTDNSASKRIVDKLRCDVKGIKNVLRKSRTGRRSNESIELQPLHGVSSSSIKTPKGVLRRMPRVRSDEINNGNDDSHGDGTQTTTIMSAPPSALPCIEKTPSPIGAGLPLLSRLRLLKEKQDREERAVKNVVPVVTQAHVTHAMSPQESIQEEREPEIIGAGLPLMQRLKLLKAKEDRAARENQEKLQVASNQGSSTTSAAQSLSPTSPTQKTSTTTSTSPAGSIPSPVTKVPLKVSFKDRIKNLQHPKEAEMKIDKLEHRDNETTDMKEALIPTISTSSKASKPSASISLKEKIKSLGQVPREEQTPPMKPWSKLKLATVVSSGGSYTSLNNSINEESPTNVHNFSTISSSSSATTAAGTVTSTTTSSYYQDNEASTSRVTIPDSAQSKINNNNNNKIVSKSVTTNDKPSATSDCDVKNVKSSSMTLSKILSAATLSTNQSTSKTMSVSVVPLGVSSSLMNVPKTNRMPKSPPPPVPIRKVSTVKEEVSPPQSTSSTTSPQHIISSLPSEVPIKIPTISSTVEAAITTKTTTIATTSTYGPAIASTSKAVMPPKIVAVKPKIKPKPFKLSREQKSYRSVDDLSPEYGGLPFVKKLKILNERQKLAELESAIQTRSFSLDYTDISGNMNNDLMEPLTRSHSEASGMARPPKINATLIKPQCLDSPLSPESNETLERRQLKSILKKLSEDKQTQFTLLANNNNNINNNYNNNNNISNNNNNNNNSINNSSNNNNNNGENGDDNINENRNNGSKEGYQLQQQQQQQQQQNQQQQQQQHQRTKKQQEFHSLLNAPTLEGYVARHSKLMKSVTFNNTLSSPPNSVNVCEAIEERSLFHLLSAQQQQQQQQQQRQQQQQDYDITTATIHASTAVIAATTIGDNIKTQKSHSSLQQHHHSLNILDENSTNNLGEHIEQEPHIKSQQHVPKQQQQQQTQHFRHHHHHQHQHQHHILSRDNSNTTLIKSKSSSRSTSLDEETNDIENKQQQLDDISSTTTTTTTTSKSSIITNVTTSQRKFLKGSIEEQEYFGEVLLGIKQVIQNHLRDVQGKFQDRFHNLEMEVKRRDDIINHLQSRIQELESVTPRQTLSPLPQQHLHVQLPVDLSRLSRSRLSDIDRERFGSSGTSTGSSIELPFMLPSLQRGDSLDTIFASSPPSDSGRPRSKCKTRKRSTSRNRSLKSRSWEESSDQESLEMQELPRSISPYRGSGGMVVSDITGNITRIPDSVVLDIEDSSSTSSNTSDTQPEDDNDEDDNEHENGDDRHIDDDDDEDDDEDDDDVDVDDEEDAHDGENVDDDEEGNDELHCDDWEIRMLAAELDRRESKKDDDAEAQSDVDEHGGLLRRRRKKSDTDTEYSDHETDCLTRPRAASLDQHNLNPQPRSKCRSVFKAMSFDRDKDRL